ncbi:lysylphosphatidylglycerol synthase transmembrane domain-containing protein [Echinicola shivajiensis]|uniref:lysylphosphatidylglycerol synthase transmembrane domain-containing protein n=1 Tax=Echinicola shivajiensis TaxID=1035916 RepID=UPI001BFC25F4|nr:lysylphosphatidylglycerol synthase transmembrane domain-containing protein [Echinicola shivajiensis]
MNKKNIKLLLKVLLTGVAIYLVIRKIDTQATWQVLKDINLGYLLLAVLFFTLSKVISSLRLNFYFRDLEVNLSETSNLKLYWKGMFYNLFLPGGIGGDGYKVYLLNKYFKGPVKKLLAAVLLDRISGLAALVFLLLGIWFFLQKDGIDLPIMDLNMLAGAGLLLTPTIFGVVYWWWFKSFRSSMLISSLYSILVQCSQLVSAYFILLALGIHEQILDYQFVFLLSSIVAVLPLTIGGVGARELVFIFSHSYMGIDKNAAVAFSLIFFLITALVSLIGAFLKVDIESEVSVTN